MLPITSTPRARGHHGHKQPARRTWTLIAGLIGFGLCAVIVLTLLTRADNGQAHPVLSNILHKIPLQQQREPAHEVLETTHVQKVNTDPDELLIDGFPAKYEKVVLSEWPSLRAYHLKSLLTPKECEHIIALATPTLKRSQVANTQNGQDKGSLTSEVRTSQGMFLQYPEHVNDPVVKTFRRRLSIVTGFPEKNFEATQVLRYEPGKFYRAHPDYFDINYDELLKRGGQRYSTVLCYLSTPSAGGATGFPAVNITVPAVTGNCVQFYSMTMDHKVDPLSFHESQPTGEGVTKWSMPTWIREYEFH